MYHTNAKVALMIVYTALDANKASFAIEAGAPFTTYWLNGQLVAINHPWTALDSYSTEDLKRFGIAATTEPDRPAPRAQLPKSTIITRLGQLNLAAQALSALQGNPVEYGLWFSPDWPNVYADDAQLLAMLQGIGCTAEQITQVTAPD